MVGLYYNFFAKGEWLNNGSLGVILSIMMNQNVSVSNQIDKLYEEGPCLMIQYYLLLTVYVDGIIRFI